MVDKIQTNNSINTAVINAGGLGTRLRPLTLHTPKPLVPIQGRPIIEHTIKQLRKHGIQNIIISIGYLAEKIQNYFGDGSSFGVNITYSIEENPLGTGGAVLQAAQGIKTPFVLVWGDNLMDIDYSSLIETYENHKNYADLIMTLTPRDDVEHFGVAKLSGEKIEYFVEKPEPKDAPSNLINAGAFVIHPRALTILPEGKSSIEKDCFEKIAQSGKIYSFEHKGQWFPTDTMERYELANKEFNVPITVNPGVFKAYDIRGEWGTDWDAECAYRIGCSIAEEMKPKTVVIGRDMRTSSDEVFRELSTALTNYGITVKDIGLCGTELTYFATSFTDDCDLALMITASHNPGKDNGIKVTKKNGVSIGIDSGLSEIRDLVVSDKRFLDTPVTGKIEQVNLWNQYKEFLFKQINPAELPRFKIVVDAANGMGGHMFDQVFEDLNCEVIRMFWEPDGSFPNHPADPSREENTTALQQRVKDEGADLGIAYDGDGDRIFVVDNTGRYVPGYYFVALMTNHMLQKNPNAANEVVVHDPRYYWATRAAISKHGATHVMSKVGHTLIKEKMREHNSPFSMECSGHTFYRETNYSESSMLTTLIVLQMIAQKGEFSKQVDTYFEQFPMSNEINFIVDDKEKILNAIEQEYFMGDVNKLDGIGIEFPEWRFIVRSSNTQPLLRLSVEAKDQTLVDDMVTQLKGIISGKEVNH